jgi:hypothetical protein
MSVTGLAPAMHSEASELGNDLAGLQLTSQGGPAGSGLAGHGQEAAVKDEPADDDSATGAARCSKGLRSVMLRDLP